MSKLVKQTTVSGRRAATFAAVLQTLDKNMNKDKPYSLERHYFLEMKINALKYQAHHPVSLMNRHTISTEHL